jgi:hypothetical protein
MIRLLRYAALGLLTILAAIAFSRAPAQAAGCSVNSPIADLVANYNPFSAPTTITVPANTVQVTCTAERSVTVKVFLSGTASGYATPSLTGPSNFTLSYTPCVPGASPCNQTTNVWNTSTGFYQFTTPNNNGTNVQSVPSFLIFVAQQDAPYGTTAQYAGNLFFSTTCNGVAC